MTDPDLSSTARDLRVVMGILKRRLREEADPGDFTPSQLTALGRLDRDGPMTVTTLANAEGVRPQSMGAIVAVLQASGFVVGEPDSADGRRTILSITPAAREEFDAGRATHESWLLRVIRDTLTPDEQRELARGVALLGRIAGAPTERTP